VRLVIGGIVQGVSYRASAADQARRLGLTGWVKNQPDGSVLLEAQGSTDRIEVLIEWCHRGPRFAQVEQVAALDVVAVDTEHGFSIQR
jgi:acylphosphatase